jgi:mono/diheme cytochrome c family protein
MKLYKIAAICVLTLLGTTSAFAQAKKPAIKPVTGALSASIGRGKLVYSKICITCHMVDGLGSGSMNPPLAKTTFVLGPKPKLASIVLNGFNENIEIDGISFSNVMPAQDFLKDQEIADVLTYVRHSFGNKASAVTVAEVKKARAAKK